MGAPASALGSSTGAGSTGTGSGSGPSSPGSSLRSSSSGIAPIRTTRPVRSVAKSTIVEGVGPGVAPPSTYTATEPRSCLRASCASVAAGSPLMLALDTASGPVARRMARATSWSGTRTPMLPLVSPRSIRRLSCAVRMRVSGPGQYLFARSRAAAGTSFVYASSTSASPMRTGGGMSRPRFLASSSPWTACGENGSAAIPYTVSVGKTTLSPARIAVRTVSIAVGRSSALTTIGSRSGSGSGSISGTASGSISGTGSGSTSGNGSPLVTADPGSCVEPSGAVAGLPSRGVVSSLDSVTRSSCQPTRAGTNDRADSQDASSGDEAPAAGQITVVADRVVAAVPCVQREHVRVLYARHGCYDT